MYAFSCINRFKKVFFKHNSNMGIKKFFKKAGAWVKDKFHKAKNVVTKFAKPVVKIAQKVGDFIQKTPLGPILNAKTGGLFGIGKRIIDAIPTGSVKDNAQKFINKAEDSTKRVIDKVDETQNKAKHIIDKGREVIGRITNVVPRNMPM